MSDVEAPIAEHRDHEVLFGKVDGEDRGAHPMDPPLKRNDPLFWLRDDARSSPEVLAHLRREKAYFEARTQDLKPLTEEIYREHISHIQETDMSPVYEDGPFLYYTREVQGKSYKIHCRVPRGKTPGKPDEEEILIDINAVAEGKAFCDVHDISPAPPTHGIFAYSVDWSGNEVYSVELRKTQAATSDTASVEGTAVVTGTNGEIVWGPDATSFFYVTKDAALRDSKVWRHVLGQPQSADVCLYEDQDPLFSVFVEKSGDGLTCLIGSVSSETSEVYLLDLRKGNEYTALELVRRRERGVRYGVEMHGPDTLIILTNKDGAVNNKVVRAARATPALWDDVLIAHREDALIETCVVRKHFMALGVRRGGLTRVWTMLANINNDKDKESTAVLDPATLREVEMDEPVYTIDLLPSQMCVYEARTFRVVYSSLATPHVWYDISPEDHHNRTVIKRREVGGGFDPSEYKVERRYATAPDRTAIPLSLVYHKSLDLSQPHPCLLYGYGSYGLSMDPEFSIKYLPYVERGMLYVVAHIRGGAEMGRAWYEIGAKYLTKRNTFSDFIAAAEHLIDAKLTTPALLACEGRSAGGLLMGAVLNMRPDLFHCAIAGVPFVDVMTTMSDPSIPLTTGEWEEWGNPNEAKYFDYMLSYSPIDNVRRQPYPAIMVQAGLHDPRVAYWEPAKWVSKLREHTTSKAEILLNMDLESGHFSAKDRYKYWRESAIQQAFVCKQLKAMARLFVKK